MPFSQICFQRRCRSHFHFLHSFNSGCYRHSTVEIVAGEIVSFHITTNKFNYRQYRKLMHHFWSQVLKQRRKFNAMTMINNMVLAKFRQL